MAKTKKVEEKSVEEITPVVSGSTLEIDKIETGVLETITEVDLTVFTGPNVKKEGETLITELPAEEEVFTEEEVVTEEDDVLSDEILEDVSGKQSLKELMNSLNTETFGPSQLVNLKDQILACAEFAKTTSLTASKDHRYYKASTGKPAVMNTYEVTSKLDLSGEITVHSIRTVDGKIMITGLFNFK